MNTKNEEIKVKIDMATKIFFAPGLLAHIRRSVAEGIQPEEFKSKDSSLNELIQRHYASSMVTLWGVKDTTTSSTP